MCQIEVVIDNIKQMKKPPIQINVLGKIDSVDDQNIVVIGTRTISDYGKDVINCLVPQLIERGFTIISGLAVGCDSYAHDVALRCKGRTIGILGYGLNHMKEDCNYQLMKRIYQSGNGAIISPFERSTPPSKFSFVYRNSVMAAVGCSVLVIEAKMRSGVFYTVNSALELGKEIYAIPGSIFNNNSVGTNELIKTGAKVVTTIKDIIGAQS